MLICGLVLQQKKDNQNGQKLKSLLENKMTQLDIEIAKGRAQNCILQNYKHC